MIPILFLTIKTHIKNSSIHRLQNPCSTDQFFLLKKYQQKCIFLDHYNIMIIITLIDL